MKEFIVQYWVQELFAVIIALFTWMVRKMAKRQNEADIRKQAMMALLHDRLYRSCSYFLTQGYCPVDDKENLECLFKPYKALGGNGTGEALYKKCIELPISEEKAKTGKMR